VFTFAFAADIPQRGLELLHARSKPALRIVAPDQTPQA
jgi:hypothetical protein